MILKSYEFPSIVAKFVILLGLLFYSLLNHILIYISHIRCICLEIRECVENLIIIKYKTNL